MFYTKKVNNNNIIINCQIKDILSSSHSGGIYINTALSLIINETTFYYCLSTNVGFIYFYLSLNIHLFRICDLGYRGIFLF